MFDPRRFFRRWFATYERYAVLEISNRHLQVSVFKYDRRRKRIVIAQSGRQEVQPKNTAELFSEAKKLLRSIKVRYQSVIIGLDPDLCSTLYSNAAIIRQQPHVLIDEADVDNIASQAIWRLFDRQRQTIAAKLGVSEIDIVLADLHVNEVRLDGHKVVNPIGFKAKTVEFHFRQTIVARDVLRGLHGIIPPERLSGICETGAALANAVLHYTGESATVAVVTQERTDIFLAQSGKIRYQDSFPWGETTLTEACRRQLGIETEPAKVLLNAYASGGMSESCARRFEVQILDPELRIFANGLESLSLPGAPVYCESYFKLPPIIFSDRFRKRQKRQRRITQLSREALFTHAGFAVQLKDSQGFINMTPLMALFFEAVVFLPIHSINHLVRRRVRWMA